MSVILFLSGSTMGDALGGSGRELAAAFEALGHRFVEINFTKPGPVDLLNRTLSEENVELALSHVGIGVDFMGETGDKRAINLWQGRGIPFISFYGDSPAYFFD